METLKSSFKENSQMVQPQSPRDSLNGSKFDCSFHYQHSLVDVILGSKPLKALKECIAESAKYRGLVVVIWSDAGCIFSEAHCSIDVANGPKTFKALE
jgi:hypothetical protein